MTAAMGMTQHDRRAEDVADDHHFLVVPAVDERARDRAEKHVREHGREEDEPRREHRSGRGGHDRDECQLVEPVAEQRDELARPQRRERAVEREADVRMLADPLDRLGRWPRDRDRDGVGRGRRAEFERLGEPARPTAAARLAPALPMATGRCRATGTTECRREAAVVALVTGAQRPSGARRPNVPVPPRGPPPRGPAARARRRRTGRTPDRGSGRHRRSMPRSGRSAVGSG